MTLSDLSDEQRKLLPAYYAGGLLPDVEFEITRLLCRPAVYGLYGENASRETNMTMIVDHEPVVVVDIAPGRINLCRPNARGGPGKVLARLTGDEARRVQAALKTEEKPE